MATLTYRHRYEVIAVFKTVSMATSLFLFLLVNIQETMAGLLLSLREWIKPHSLLFFEKGGNRWLI